MLTVARAVTARIKGAHVGLPCKVFAECLRCVVTHPHGWDARSGVQGLFGRKCRADIKSIADRYGGNARQHEHAWRAEARPSARNPARSRHYFAASSAVRTRAATAGGVRASSPTSVCTASPVIGDTSS